MERITERQTKLESAMSRLTEKVDAMDSKLDQILSLLLPGHGDDAKKGEKSKQSNPDDANPGSSEKEATSDAAKNLPKQLTHVAGQGTSKVNPDSEQSGSKATSDSVVLKQVTQVAAKEGNSDLLIDSVEEAAKLYQALEIKGNIHKVHYKDPRLLLVDELAARKLLESEFPGEDIEQILQEEKLYLSQSKTEKSKTGRKGGRRRTPNVSMKGVIIPRNDRPNTRASSKLPSIPEGDKGKKVIEGPPEVKEVSNPKMAEFFSEQVTTDANLALTIEEEEEEVTELTLRKKKKKAESKVVEVINPVERKNSKASGYIVQASQALKKNILTK